MLRRVVIFCAVRGKLIVAGHVPVCAPAGFSSHWGVTAAASVQCSEARRAYRVRPRLQRILLRRQPERVPPDTAIPPHAQARGQGDNVPQLASAWR